MSRVQSIDDPQYVNNQYRNASNLNARIRLHQQFSTNKYGWQRWLFDQFNLPLQGHILELGCGAGNLWLENLDRIPAGLEIVLSDFSAGMLQQAQHNLRNSQPFFQFRIIDAQSIPFDDNGFDIVIANHMLIHVPDRAKALLEIQRILKPTGRFYASTTGKNHLKELNDLISRFDSQLTSWGKLPSDSFSLENGSTQLGECFANVSLYGYTDSLIVTDATLLTDYILSGRIELNTDQQLDLAKFVRIELQANNGKFYITKDSGVFESSGILQA
jgi:ubiquinone/menaquinone biosynthesis C-methylase UbiE